MLRKKVNRTIIVQFPDTYRIEDMVNCYCRKIKSFDMTPFQVRKILEILQEFLVITILGLE